MQTRPLGKTGLNLPLLSFGASSLGQEFRRVDLNEALRCVRVALDLGMNFIDTSPYYGRGMSEAVMARAFDDFYTTREGGTGLGLSVVRRLTTDLHGSLAITSAPGRGTTVTLQFPALPSTTDSSRASAPVSRSARADRTHRR